MACMAPKPPGSKTQSPLMPASTAGMDLDPKSVKHDARLVSFSSCWAMVLRTVEPQVEEIYADLTHYGAQSPRSQQATFKLEALV